MNTLFALLAISSYVQLTGAALASTGRSDNENAVLTSAKPQMSFLSSTMAYTDAITNTDAAELRRPSNDAGFYNDCPSIMKRKACVGYARKWVKFYIEIGGWIMLSVIILGIFMLIATQIFSQRIRSRRAANADKMFQCNTEFQFREDPKLLPV